jgi:hypothetical protein
MITYEDTYYGRVYHPDNYTLDDALHPLQIGPASISTNMKGDAFWVLELISNTITVVPAITDPNSPWRSAIDLNALVAYRSAALAAFIRLFGRLLEFLKDCICDHLLVDCPTGLGKVYLADVSFQGGKVYQICNFHHRKYVHTFPTVEYWLSLVPVLPMLKMAVEKLCCTAITETFDKMAAAIGGDPKSSDVISATMAQNAMTYVRAANLPAQYQLRKTQLATTWSFAKSALATRLRLPSPGNVSAPTNPAEVVNKTAADANKVASANGIVVANTETVSSLGAVQAMASAPPIARGDTVNLLIDPTGKVVGWKKVTPAPAPAATAAAPAVSNAATKDEVATLRAQLVTMTDAHAQQAATIAELQKNMTTMAATLASIKK